MTQVASIDSVKHRIRSNWFQPSIVNMPDTGKMQSNSPSGRENVPKQEFEAKECKTETVVVYLDRAEVCKTLKAKVEAGENEIHLNKLSRYVDRDSVRVEGKGAATIVEVMFETKEVSDDDVSGHTEKEKEMIQKRKDLNMEMTILEMKQRRVVKQRHVLDGFADHLTDPRDGKSEHVPIDSNTLQGMSSFFDLYDNQAARLDTSIHDISLEMKKLKDEVRALDRALGEHQDGAEDLPKEERMVTIVVDAAEAGEVELYVSYVVSHAKWSPKYDIRVFSNDNTMKILYYGVIQQSTGEDWNDAKLCLSTAMPSIGGILPELGVQRLSFKPKQLMVQPQMRMYSPPMRVADDSNSEYSASQGMYNGQEHQEVYMQAAHVEPLPEMEVAFTEVFSTIEARDAVTSTMYEIARRATVPSDNAEHKVSVAAIDLKPEIEYECVPKLALHAYLKARVKNTSPYALLAGPTNIFLDNNFISKAELSAVSPSEDFECSLGVDPAVRVVYKPIHKYHEQSGYISKSAVTTYKQDIELKNTHKDAIHMFVTDQLPQSTEEKIKVLLHEPNVRDSGKGEKNFRAGINRLGNVLWDLHLGPNETKTLVLRYTIEHPINENVEVSHVPSSSSDV